MRKCMLFVVAFVLVLASVADGQQVAQKLRVSYAWPIATWRRCGVLFNGAGWIPDVSVGASTCPGVAGVRCSDALTTVTFGQSYPLAMECVVASPNPGQTPSQGPPFVYVARAAGSPIPVPTVPPPTATRTPTPTRTVTPTRTPVPTVTPFLPEIWLYYGKWMRFVPDPKATP